MPRHAHSHDHAHPHLHDGPAALTWALAITLAFAAVEALAGLWSGSLALLGDAGHMLTDSLALGLAAAAARFARHPPSARHSFGLARLEVLAALANAGFMAALVLGIAVQAALRLAEPRVVDGPVVSAVAAIGLVLNLAVAAVLMRGQRTLNTRGALLHVVGDALGSVAALVAGIVIQTTGWMAIDPLLSLFICLLIGGATWRLAREAIHTLLEGVPPELSLPQVGRRMASVEAVRSVHDLHIWTIASGRVALSAHVVVDDLAGWSDALTRLRVLLHEEFGIDHVTLQPELAAAAIVRVAQRRQG